MRNYTKGIVMQKQKFTVGKKKASMKLGLWSLGIREGNGEVPSTDRKCSG